MIRILQILPFFQALATGLGILYYLLFLNDTTRGQYVFTLFSISDIVCFIGFGLALIKRHLWGVYALICYSVVNLLIKSLRGFGSIWWSLLFIVVYAIGGIILYRSDHLSPPLTELNFKRIVRLAIVLYIGNFIIGFGLGFIRLGNSGAENAIQWAIFLFWWILAFTLFARQPTPWVFETFVLISITVLLVGLIDIFLGFITPILWISNFVHTMACGMIGWGFGKMIQHKT